MPNALQPLHDLCTPPAGRYTTEKRHTKKDVKDISEFTAGVDPFVIYLDDNIVIDPDFPANTVDLHVCGMRLLDNGSRISGGSIPMYGDWGFILWVGRHNDIR